MIKMIRLTGIKFLLTCVVSALIVVGCTKSEAIVLQDRVDSEILSFNTKTSLEVGENAIKTLWAQGDRIGVFGEISGENLPYILETGAGSTHATFVSENGSCEGRKRAYYPYSENNSYYFPTVQKYINGAPDSRAAFMISDSYSENLSFKNVFSVLGLRLKSDVSRRISQVVFRDKSGANVSGDFSVSSKSDGSFQLAFSEVLDESYSKIVLDAGSSGVAINSDSYTHFYIFIPARYYEKGFSVEFITSDAERMTKTVGKNGVEIKNSVFYEMPTIDNFIKDVPARTWGGFLLKGVSPESGWFDVNKLQTKSFNEDGELVGDSFLCWAAATSNIIDWWQATLNPADIPSSAPFGAYINSSGEALPTGNSSAGQSNVFRYFTKVTINSGNFMTNALDWYLNHSSAIPIQRKYEDDPSLGGFYKELMGPSRHTEMVQWWAGASKQQAMNFFKSQLERAVDNNWGINLNYSIGGGGHAVTCWGYELGNQELSAYPSSEDQILTQEKLEADNGSDFVKYVYLTDSDDAFDSPNNSLIRAGVVYKDNGEIIIVYNGPTERRLMSFIFAKF